ncbi:MAG: NAD(P)-dependent oxidoreductase [Proteobacteria bacterium]|nr:NAD(P)-dependent oxidoreductase [Pseudomonadota bacterium]
MTDTVVGVVGLGIMGSAISANLLDAGFAVVGYDVVADKLDALSARGGRAASSARDVAEQASIVLLSLPSVAALDATIGAEDGLIASRRQGLIVIETSTLPIADKQRGRDALGEAGMILLDCPLSGTGAQAATRDVAVYGSGDKAAYEACVPVFDGFARAHYYLGEFASGSRMKFVANLLVAIHNVAAAEAFVLGMKAGLDAETIYRVVADGAGSSRMFEVRGPMMVAGDYDDAMMKLEVWQKDMRIIGDFAKALDCPTPMFSASARWYAEAMAQGRATQDTAAVCAVLEDLAGLKRRT